MERFIDRKDLKGYEDIKNKLLENSGKLILSVSNDIQYHEVQAPMVHHAVEVPSVKQTLQIGLLSEKDLSIKLDTRDFCLCLPTLEYVEKTFHYHSPTNYSDILWEYKKENMKVMVKNYLFDNEPIRKWKSDLTEDISFFFGESIENYFFSRGLSEDLSYITALNLLNQKIPKKFDEHINKRVEQINKDVSGLNMEIRSLENKLRTDTGKVSFQQRINEETRKRDILLKEKESLSGSNLIPINSFLYKLRN